MGNSKSVSCFYLAHFSHVVYQHILCTVVLLLLLLRAILDMFLEHAVSLLWSSRRLVWVWDEEDDLQTAVFIYFRTLRCTSFSSRWPCGQTRLWITSFLLNKGSQWCNWPQIHFSWILSHLFSLTWCCGQCMVFISAQKSRNYVFVKARLVNRVQILLIDIAMLPQLIDISENLWYKMFKFVNETLSNIEHWVKPKFLSKSKLFTEVITSGKPICRHGRFNYCHWPLSVRSGLFFWQWRDFYFGSAWTSPFKASHSLSGQIWNALLQLFQSCKYSS